MNTDKHYMWYMAGAGYDRYGYGYGNGYSDGYGYGYRYGYGNGYGNGYDDGDGSMYSYVESRVLNAEVYTFGYSY
jgi:hypothetical protein